MAVRTKRCPQFGAGAQPPAAVTAVMSRHVAPSESSEAVGAGSRIVAGVHMPTRRLPARCHMPGSAVCGRHCRGATPALPGTRSNM
jgi:hypothetical protein